MKDQIFQLYNFIEIGKNETCQRCIKSNKESDFELSAPISAWIVGENFKNDKHKILFVGKVARGDNDDIGQIKNGLFRDATNLGESLLRNSSWAYWSYTRAIVEKLYQDIQIGIENIAFTNLIKCNNSPTVDMTTWETKQLCLNELKVFWKELELLKPKKVIFYTNWEYDNFIDDYKRERKFEDKSNRNHRVQIGAKQMPWWNRVFYDSNGKKEWEFLRIGHPERKKKNEFTQRVYEWIIE